MGMMKQLWIEERERAGFPNPFEYDDDDYWTEQQRMADDMDAEECERMPPPGPWDHLPCYDAIHGIVRLTDAEDLPF